MAGMLIGQLNLIGVLALKKAVYAIPTLSPLLAITILFMILVAPKRIRVAEHLPSLRCVELDEQYKSQECDTDFAKGEYLQSALKYPKLYPEVDVN